MDDSDNKSVLDGALGNGKLLTRLAIIGPSRVALLIRRISQMN